MTRRTSFGTTPMLIGVVHVPALPGAPGFAGRMEAVQRRACEDAARIAHAGFDGLILENFGDAPFFKDAVPPVTVAALAAVADRVRQQVSLPVGINVLRNDVGAALAIAAAVGAAFVRVNVHVGAMVTDQGLVEGRAAETLRLRSALAPEVRIFADFRVKHAAPLVERPWEEELADLVERGSPDAVLFTGGRTGLAPDLAPLTRARDVVGRTPLFVASGATVANVGELLELADGIIVGSALERGGKAGNPVDPERARAFVTAARTPRGKPARPRRSPGREG